MKYLTIFFFLLFSGFTFSTETEHWKTHKEKDFYIRSNIVDHKDGKLVQYVATKNLKMSVSQAKEYLLNFANHKTFLESTTESKLIKQSGPNDFIVYLNFDPPWPMPNSDCVQAFTLKEMENGFELSGRATPDAYEKKNERRMTYYNIVYTITRIDHQNSKVILKADFVPVGSIPKFLLNTWFPKGPIGILERFQDGVNG